MDDPPAPPPDTVRERLSDSTRLQVTTDDSGGVLTAERKVGAAWESGMVELVIENGELIVSADSRDALTLEGLQVAFAPIGIPPGVFGGTMAQLTDVRVDLTAPTKAAATWVSANEVSLAVDLDLTLSWKLALDGAPAPLGSPRLPKVPVTITLSGNGEHVSASIAANAPGELWSWAGLIKLRDMSLSLGAALD